jgi:hypothetical protein
MDVKDLKFSMMIHSYRQSSNRNGKENASRDAADKGQKLGLVWKIER